MASPDGSHQPGTVIDLPNGQELVDGGYAELLEPVNKPEQVSSGEHEERDDPDPSAATAKKKK